jgi:hypothetical protein
MAKKTFLILEKAWQLEGGRLVDFKVEFGLDASGRLLLADVIDNDSWRVIQNEHYIDKQVYRDGGALDRVASLYRQVSDATSRFKLPDQQIILWKDSDFHDLEPFLKHLSPFANSRLKLNQIDCRIANNPKSLYQLLQNKIQETPDTILLCYLHGRNEAASTLSINGTVPLIATAAKRDPSQAGASLSPSSQNPALIAIEPENAALAALQILGSRNPLIYMHLRLNEEERLADLLGLDE